MELTAMYSYAKPYIDDKSIIRTFEIYHEWLFDSAQTVITIVDADKRSETVITLPYIQRDTNIIFDVAKAVIESRAVQ